MSKGRGARRAAMALIVFGVMIGISALTGLSSMGAPSFLSLLPAVTLIAAGATLRGHAQRDNPQPRVPPGFAPAGADTASPAATDTANPGGLPDPAGPVDWAGSPDPEPPDGAAPAPAGSQRSIDGGIRMDTSPAREPAAGEGSAAAPVPADVREQVSELAIAGRTVEAIEALREATGMELYEASQYVLEIRRSAR